MEYSRLLKSGSRVASAPWYELGRRVARGVQHEKARPGAGVAVVQLRGACWNPGSSGYLLTAAHPYALLVPCSIKTGALQILKAVHTWLVHTRAMSTQGYLCFWPNPCRAHPSRCWLQA